MFTMALFSEMRKVLAASAVFVMGLVLTACSSGDADDTVSSSPVATVDTEHSSTQSAPDELEESTTQAPSAVPEEETASSPSSESQMKQDFISALDSMGEEDALMYTGNGSGPLAGTRFQTARSEERRVGQERRSERVQAYARDRRKNNTSETCCS